MRWIKEERQDSHKTIVKGVAACAAASQRAESERVCSVGGSKMSVGAVYQLTWLIQSCALKINTQLPTAQAAVIILHNKLKPNAHRKQSSVTGKHIPLILLLCALTAVV